MLSQVLLVRVFFQKIDSNRRETLKWVVLQGTEYRYGKIMEDFNYFFGGYHYFPMFVDI
jgi:hypothetical protein